MTESGIGSPTSTTAELGGSAHKMADKLSYRKSSKPLMERKRRARINHCLGQLKSLVLQAMKKDNSQYSKLEKADILELTVKHLKQVQRQTSGSNSNQIPEALNKYRAGFNECANEVMRYLGETQGVNVDAKTRIISHLSTILTPVNSLHLQPQDSYPHILPAPPTSYHHLQLYQQQHHHHQQQQQQQHHHQQPKTPQEIQHQQERVQHTLHNEISRPETQGIPNPLFPMSQTQTASHILDYNNNVKSSVNNNESLKNSHQTSVLASSVNKNTLSVPPSLSHNPEHHDTSVHSPIKPEAIEPNFSFQALNINTSPRSSVQIPCLSVPNTLTPGPNTLTPAQFQLVQSTLPNGQLALVLAPQTLPPLPASTAAIQHTSHFLPKKTCELLTESQQQQLSIAQEQSSCQSNQYSIHHKQGSISPASAIDLPKPVSFHKQTSQSVNQISSNSNAEVKIHQPVAFRPTATSSSTHLTKLHSNVSYSLQAGNSFSEVPRTSMSKEVKCEQEGYSRGASNSPEKNDRHSNSPNESRERNLPSPDNIRQLFEHKFGKRRSVSGVTDSNSTWRPW